MYHCFLSTGTLLFNSTAAGNLFLCVKFLNLQLFSTVFMFLDINLSNTVPVINIYLNSNKKQ